MVRRYGFRSLASAMLFVSILSLSWGAPPSTSSEDGPEVSPAAAGLLKQLNTASEQTLKGTMDLPEGIVAKILAYRASGAKFANLVEVHSVIGISSAEIERILMPFEQAEAARAFEAQRKPVPDPGPPGKAGGKLRRGPATTEQDKGAVATPGSAAGSEGAVSGTGPITMVRPGFYGKLPGFDDLDKIDPLKRTEFLETVNREFCTCGCKNETIAFCLVNDPTCPVVKSRAKKIYDDILNKPAP